MTTKQLIVVYKGRNSPSKMIVNLNGAPLDFVAIGVSVVGLVLDGVEYQSPEYLQYNSSGEVTFTLGSIPTPPEGKVTARLVIYSPDYPLGKPILTEKTDHKLQFEFV